MSGTKKELIDSINRSMTTLQCEAHRCRCLMAAVLEQNIDEGFRPDLSTGSPPGTREETLKDAIKEAIEVLDESRKAFKSRTTRSF